MDNQETQTIQLVNHFKEWYDEKINTITGFSESGVKSISFTENEGEEFANITGRDKDMFLLGLKISLDIIGAFPISMTDANDLSLIDTTDSNRLQFLTENRLRVEKWNTAPSTTQYYVYNDEDSLVSQDFTMRDAIDLAIEKYTAQDSA